MGNFLGYLVGVGVGIALGRIASKAAIEKLEEKRKQG